MELTQLEFNIVYNVLSFVIATMGAAAIYFFLSQNQVERDYKPALVYAGLVVAIACYHYFRLFNSWNEAYELSGDMYVATEHAFRESYRYVDWLLTVPLLMIEIVDVLNMRSKEARSLKIKLVIGIVLMIIAGYPGEVLPETDPTKWVWWAIATAFMVYVLYVLWTGLTKNMGEQPDEVVGMLSKARILLTVVFIWYAFVYLWPLLGITGSGAIVATNVGYAVADILAKAGFGLYIVSIAKRKSRVETEQHQYA